MVNQNGWSDDRRDYSDDSDAWRRLRDHEDRGGDYGRRQGAGATRDRDYGAADYQASERTEGYRRGRTGGSAAAYGQGAYGQESHGQGAYGQGSYGQGSYGQGGYGRDGGRGAGEDFNFGRGSGGYDRYEGGRDYRADEPRSWWDRTSDKVSSFFGDDDAARRNQRDERYAGQHGGRGPKDYKRSDDRIREDVNDRLTDDPHVDATEISVAVKDGEVTLSGTVQHRQDKRRAEDIAERCSGVKHVQNNIRVHDRNYDAQIAQAGSSSTQGSTATSGATGSRSSLS